MLKGCLLQIEGKVPIRELVKTPRKGDLPISDAHKSELDFAPNKVEDLNAVVPKSGQQLSTPQQNSKVSSFSESFV